MKKIKFFERIKRKFIEKMFGQKCTECGEIWYPYSGVKTKNFVCPDCFVKNRKNK